MPAIDYRQLIVSIVVSLSAVTVDNILSTLAAFTLLHDLITNSIRLQTQPVTPVPKWLGPETIMSRIGYTPNGSPRIDYDMYICWAQSVDLRNPWIALRTLWIHTLRRNPWIAQESVDLDCLRDLPICRFCAPACCVRSSPCSIPAASHQRYYRTFVVPVQL